MRNLQKISIVFCLLLFASLIHAKPEKLELTFTKGEKLNYKINILTKQSLPSIQNTEIEEINVQSKITAKLGFEVIGIDNEIATIKMIIREIDFKMSMGGDDLPELPEFTRIKEKFTGTAMELTIMKNGDVKEVKLQKEVTSQGNEPNIEEMLKSALKQSYGFLPDKAVDINDKWDKAMKMPAVSGVPEIPIVFNNTLDSYESLKSYNCAKIATKINIEETKIGDESANTKLSASGTAVTYFSPKEGRLIKAVSTMKLKIKIAKSELTTLADSELELE